MTLPDREVIATRAGVSLGRYRASDFAAVHEYATDPMVYRYAEWGPNSAEQTRQYLLEASLPNSQALTLAVLVDEQVIGGAAVWSTDADHRCGELGYSLNRKFWGRGYATLATKMLLDLGFSSLDLHRITATCAPENSASRRVLEKAGFAYEGHLREHKLVGDRRRDSLLFARLATD
ncbi:GNAT family N-acetyltransferase [Arthrobacter sp. MYb211]|uniref:GNAT family N-acetyltransferase n=1 Tax=unclassified Arthrobacter TaxID=235627 RepID=UPI000CFD8230|nr:MULTISPECIES: GNAT family N-acetyltransferase [unclassified Arthrobacter]PRA08204.1 GNAT family N-acetyltransferase [Arthrobacter sp. MYb221]PRC02257.1 GNAT family N-acetyltransferase [Arthrobacter sp. MYb211]